MAIITLPLPITLLNGTVADAGQVMTDLNAIATNVNANAAKSGTNSDITSLTALISIADNVSMNTPSILNPTITGGTITGTTITSANSIFTNVTITGGTITGVAIDATSTVPTAAPGTNTTQIASTAFVVNTAFSSQLPAQLGNAGKFLFTNGTIASWQFVFPTQTGNAGRFLQTDGTVVSWQLPLPVQTGNAGKYLTTNGTVAAWAFPVLNRSARTANTILAVADQSSFIDITSGTFTQTFTAAATLGTGWYILIRNSGTGDITLDPNGAETIDGLTTMVLYPGDSRYVIGNGANFFTAPVSPGAKTFTTTGTHLAPEDGWYELDIIGGGGGGASGQRSTGYRIGGCGGGAATRTLVNIFLAKGTSTTATVAAGGIGGPAQTVNTSFGLAGTDGGNSTFGTLVTGFGGQGAPAATTHFTTGGNGGGSASSGTGGSLPQLAFTLSAGTIRMFNNLGGGGGTTQTIAGTVLVGNAEWGGGAGGGIVDPGGATVHVSVAGGSSIWGPGAGGPGGSFTSGSVAEDPKAGGKSGSYNNGGGGTAAAGVPGGAGATDPNRAGDGGGGGSANAGVGFAGGLGGVGAGGGGGGASDNGSNSGAGGNGGRGEIRIRKL